jgi:hypothetical protein
MNPKMVNFRLPTTGQDSVAVDNRSACRPRRTPTVAKQRGIKIRVNSPASRSALRPY